MNMRVDVVAAPVRYRRMPLVLLLLIAIVPTVILAAAYLRLDREADRYDARVEALATSSLGEPGDLDDLDDALSAAEVAAAARRAALSTSLFQYRRIPGPSADLANAIELRSEVRPVFGFLNEESCVAVSANGLDVAGHNPDRAVVPASVQKVLVAAVALEVLGPDYTFTTSVRTPLPVDGVVEGDVYLVGGGDPLLTSDDYPIDEDRYPAFSTTSLDVLADAFVANGITRIRGTVIGDGTRYDDEFVVEGWGPGVAFDSAGPYDALLVNDARVLGRGQADDPNRGAARELARLLGNRDVRVDDGWGSGQAATNTQVIGTVESAPLSEIVREMLTTSDNNTAEMLVKEIGRADAGASETAGIGTRAAGLTVIDRTLRTWGVPMAGVRVLDGSGLHLENRLTCAALLHVLQRAPGTAVASGLPLAGETGTLSDEFIGSPVAGRLFAKTGTLNNPPVGEPPPAAKSLAGFVTSPAGGTIEFAIILNAAELPEPTYRQIWAEFATRFSTFPAITDVTTLGPQ
ncbi:MAG: hypothetical protein HKN44_11960 [Ilumatobacter sp.]|nr:hypothetical protein [Ilumatobacter sp.]